MGKSDRAFVIGALGLVTFFFPAVLKLWPWVFIAGAVLAAVTCVNRMAKALSELKTG
jgi:hypothetical protein